MEKQRNSTESKSFCRLLIYFLFSIFIAGSLSAQNITVSQLQQLRIAPVENQKLYAKSEIKFQVVLPNVPAASVQIQSPNETKDVTFKTLRKTELYSGSTDTKIELWFTFDKKGTYHLSPLTVIINDRNRSIQFDEITIENDPASMPARFVIKFDNNKTVYSDDDVSRKTLFDAVVGEKLSYTIYLQYAVQLLQFNWELPKDSILTQTESFEITEIKYREKNYSDELIPVASFEWVSLSEGKHTMPVIKISATGYNGYRSSIRMPEFFINFVDSNVKEKYEADMFFADAFNSSYIPSSKNEAVEISDEDCEHLAELRKIERHAFFNLSSARKDRREFEQSLDLPSAQNEYPVFILYLSIATLIVLIVIFIFLNIKHKHLAKIFLIVTVICNLVIIINAAVQSSKKYAIFKQTQILSVPDESATSSNELSSGTRVRILEQTEEWNYIEVGDIGGWVKAERLSKI